MLFNVASWEMIKGAVCKNWSPVEIIIQIYRGQHNTSCPSIYSLVSPAASGPDIIMSKLLYSLHSVDGFNGNSDILH